MHLHMLDSKNIIIKNPIAFYQYSITERHRRTSEQLQFHKILFQDFHFSFWLKFVAKKNNFRRTFKSLLSFHYDWFGNVIFSCLNRCFGFSNWMFPTTSANYHEFLNIIFLTFPTMTLAFSHLVPHGNRWFVLKLSVNKNLWLWIWYSIVQQSAHLE